jgi:hypothetical protein
MLVDAERYLCLSGAPKAGSGGHCATCRVATGGMDRVQLKLAKILKGLVGAPGLEPGTR